MHRKGIHYMFHSLLYMYFPSVSCIRTSPTACQRNRIAFSSGRRKDQCSDGTRGRGRCITLSVCGVLGASSKLASHNPMADASRFRRFLQSDLELGRSPDVLPTLDACDSRACRYRRTTSSWIFCAYDSGRRCCWPLHIQHETAALFYSRNVSSAMLYRSQLHCFSNPSCDSKICTKYVSRRFAKPQIRLEKAATQPW